MFVERDIQERFDRAIASHGMVALLGARQSGKTTFLRHNMQGRDASYVMLDRTPERERFETDLEQFELQHIKGHELTVLDEVQHAQDSGVRLKNLVDSGARLWVTSSSEVVMTKDVLGHLVGRVAILRLYPFSLREFLRARGQRGLTPGVLEAMVREHMLYGGYPRAVLSGDGDSKAMVLENLYETVLLKDVTRAYSIDNLKGLEDLAMYVAANPGGIMRYDAVASDLGMMVPTLKKYLDALERCYLLVRVRPFFTNRAKEISKQPKVYHLDTGIRNAILGDFRGGMEGKVFEGYVLGELVKMGLPPRYWHSKGGAEVDFVVRMRDGPVPIEVKLKADRGEMGRGLRSFIERYGPKKAFVVSFEGERGEERIDRCPVRYVDVLRLAESLQAGKAAPEA